ncbi:hypothetical protein Y032_0763g2146 [Ancylostoma ceylanicum]|uniref:Uncharacterized protein n=1 Tax=Ancylostoma ceylanicum TaxID=53326 RepID=A0A016WFN4_9BILA|nr:hypothetical protein Y032_0763g2146 [Ancylostoma ceylanicum]
MEISHAHHGSTSRVTTDSLAFGIELLAEILCELQDIMELRKCGLEVIHAPNPRIISVFLSTMRALLRLAMSPSVRDFIVTSTILSFLVIISGSHGNFTSFIDYETTAVGLRDDKEQVCLSVTFAVTIINLNINSTHNRLPFDLTSTKISGYCAKKAKGDALLTATAEREDRKKVMKFYFATKTVLVKKYEELRWQLRKVVYSETYGDDTVTFESDNSSIIITAPLPQKYVCKDRINITMHCQGFSDVIAEFSPDIDVQPYGPKSNFYLCERTRKRTLTESFEHKATVFSGVVLGLTSVSAMIGHAIRRHFIPERKQMYENLGVQ